MRNLHRMTDRELFSLLGSGDAEAFHHIFLRYNRALYTTAYGKLRDKEEAKDVVQDIFANLWHKREDICLRKDQLAPYLHVAVRHRILDILAKKKKGADYIADFQSYLKQFDDRTDNPLRESLLTAIINKEISFLPNRMRKIFLMSRYDHLSHKEIADQMKIADSTVTDQVKKALKILRSKLGHLSFLLIFIKFF